MARSFTVRVFGVGQTKGKIRQYKDALTKALQQETKNRLQQIRTDAQRDSPVDTGENRREIAVDLAADQLSGTVTANAPHAPFLEFGTGSGVQVPEGFEEVAMEFKGEGKRTVNRPAKPFLIPNYLKALPVYRENIRNILRGKGINFQTRI